MLSLPPAAVRQQLLAPAAYCLALAGFLAIYYVAHTVLFGTRIV